jgi:hypothetical protein
MLLAVTLLGMRISGRELAVFAAIVLVVAVIGFVVWSRRRR